jgi:penicillin-binding protein 1A
MRPWPNNSTGIFSERYAYIYQAVKESLNTVAVKCLADYGINNSIKFLEEKFAIPLSYEKELSAKRGEEEVMGNIALGFLSQGVSTVDMAGYYQIFANGGKYQAPKTILKICDCEGNEIYSRQYSQKQVFKSTTADMMNYILKEVVSPGGTGEKARCEKVRVAGKTGTDDLGENNWFVGVTPEYSAAFWHGFNDKNIASQIFSSAINEIYNELSPIKREFIYTSPLERVVYCTETGKRAGANCGLIHMGYFTREEVPSPCDRH